MFFKLTRSLFQATQKPFKLSPSALQVILDYEVGGGESYYDIYLIHPIWPGGQSGVTIGIGYDLGNYTLEEFTNDWQAHLPVWHFQLLRLSLNIRAEAARDRLSLLSTVTIPWSVAFQVFQESTLPRFYQLTCEVFPGVEKCAPDVQGALVSLVFNRGVNMEGDRRLEMRIIRDAVPRRDYPAIAKALRDMQRLWIDQEMDAVIERREAEARLIDKYIS